MNLKGNAKLMINVFVISASSLTLMMGCAGEESKGGGASPVVVQPDKPSENGGGDGGGTPDTPPRVVPSFAQVSAIFNTSCVACHDGGNFNAADYESVKAKAADIRRRVDADQPGVQMPPRRKLPADQIALIKQWVDGGAPQ